MKAQIETAGGVAMTGKRIGWIAGGLGALLLLGVAIYLISGLTAGNLDRPVFNPAWELCGRSDACVAVPAPCGEWQPVNEKYKDDAAAYYGHLITVVEETEMVCVSEYIGQPPRGAYCLSGVCALAR